MGLGVLSNSQIDGGEGPVGKQTHRELAAMQGRKRRREEEYKKEEKEEKREKMEKMEKNCLELEPIQYENQWRRDKF